MIHSGRSIMCNTNGNNGRYNSIPDEYLVLTNTSEYNNDQQASLEPTNMNSMGQSENSEKFTKLCRICANTNNHMISIFEGEGVQHGLSAKIHKYLPIQISENDTLSLYMCYHCASTLLAWHDLLEGCLDAEQKLLRMQTESNCQEEEKFVFAIPESNETNQAMKVIQTTQSDVMDIQALPEATCESKNDQDEKSSTVVEERCRNEQSMLGETNRIDETADNLRYSEYETWNTDIELLYHDVNNENNPKSIHQGFGDYMATRCMKLTSSKSENVGVLPKKSMVNMPKFGDVNEQIDVNGVNGIGERELINEAKTVIDGKVVYRCDICNKQLLTRRGYIRHIRIHFDHRPCVCTKCGNSFRIKQDLMRHMSDVHDGIKKYICDICERAFANKNARDDHRRIHTGEKPYACEKCQKTFRTLNCLYIHKRGHSDYKPHQCTTCGISFRSKQRLNNHMTTHTGIKAFPCALCGKSFSVKSEAVRHHITHNVEKPFGCTICGMNFGQKRYVWSHIKLHHKKQSNELFARLNIE